MLGKTGTPLTDAEKAAIEQEVIDKAQRDSEQAELDEIERLKVAEKKQQDFDDLLSGKNAAASEKNLQTLFKEFYAAAQTINPKEVADS